MLHFFVLSLFMYTGHPSRIREDLPASVSTEDHVINLPQQNHATLPALQPPSQPKKFISSSPHSILKQWGWWIVVFLNIVSVLAGQTVATLLGRFYFNEGGNSLWMATVIQSAGAPLLILPLLLVPKKSSIARPPLRKIVPIYIVLGFIVAGDNLMYSYGLLYLPVSTYSLICATQLGFNAIFSYFINKQKFTALIFNSVVLLTFSAALLGVNSDSSDSNIPKDKYPLGFVLTLGASATFSLIISLMQLTFETVIKAETFSWVLELQMYTNLVASLVTVAGLFISDEWKNITEEFQGYKTGKASYALTLAGTAVGWQVFSVGLIGLISLVSSLFANVISTLALPLVPVFAVIFFHDGMNGVKVVAMLIAVWGFLSYIYQHYLDDSKAKKKAKENGLKDVNQS
jgi:drug/metabolite transporter (DMT)-like permease